MFFRRKKKKLDENSNLVYCQSPTCPTPDLTHPKENSFSIDGVILCQFCFTKKLSENPPETTINESKTKKVDNVELNRISSHQASWDIKNEAAAHLSRIGPSSENEKYMEEISVWKEIFKEFSLDQKFPQIRKISRLSQVQHTRLIESSGGSLLASFVSEKEHKSKLEAEKIQMLEFSTEKFETLDYETKKLSKQSQDWLRNNKLLENSDNSNVLLRITVIEDKCIPFEEITEQLNYLDMDLFLYELGRFFYYQNYLGYSYPFQIFVIKKEDAISFINANFTYLEKAFSNVKTALQHLYLVFPTMLDENYLQKFTEGTNFEQQALTSKLTQDQTFMKEVQQFFKNENIQYDDKKPLPSFDFTQEN